MNSQVLTGLALVVAGVVFTFVIKTGFIWWGAIVVGAIMIVRGLTRN
jgi:hypothetical protein